MNNHYYYYYYYLIPPLVFFFLLSSCILPVTVGYMNRVPFMRIRQQTAWNRAASSSSFADAQEALFERMDQFVNTENSCRLVVAVAGGGTHLASTLAATPGASRVLLEAVTLYDREAFRSFVGNNNNNNQTNLKQFATLEAARLLATAAIQRALQLTVGPTSCARPEYHSTQHMIQTIGLACASQLVVQEHDDTKSHAHIVAHLPLAAAVHMSCTIPSSFSRRHQDVQLAHSMLSCLEYALYARQDCYSPTNTDDYAVLWKERLQQHNVTATITSSSSSQLEWTETTDTGEQRHVQVMIPTRSPVLEAAHSIVSQQESVMLLIPHQEQQHFRVIRGSLATLPPHSIIVPGSFNPPHTGHVQLALAALQAHAATNPVIWFELSLTNADKPPLQPETVAARIQQFWNVANELQGYQWGILLTNAPLFVQKINLLHPMTLNNNDDHTLTFCIGTDTLVRLLDPKYYQNSREMMLTTLEQLPPCHFVAGGRVDPHNPAVFVTGEAAVADLPPHVGSKFTLLPQFRVDISSTEVRRRKQQEEQRDTNEETTTTTRS